MRILAAVISVGLYSIGCLSLVQETGTHKIPVPSWNELKQIPGISRKSFGPREQMVIYSLDGGNGVSDASRCVETEKGIWRVGRRDGGSPKVRSQ